MPYIFYLSFLPELFKFPAYFLLWSGHGGPTLFFGFFLDGQEHSWVLQNKLKRRKRCRNLKFPRTHCILHKCPALGFPWESSTCGNWTHQNKVGRCRQVPSPKHANQEWMSAVCTVTFYSVAVASLSFYLYVTCHSITVLNHMTLLSYFVDCDFTWKIKLETNNACHFYSMINAFGLGLPDNLGQNILISVVSTVKGIISRKKNVSSFEARIQHIVWYIYDFKKATKLGKFYFLWWRWCLIAVEYFSCIFNS